jgi:dynein heavy chain 2
VQVYDGAEALFVSLADELKKYQDWVALGMVGAAGGGELDDYVDAQLEEVSDWELNLRMLKAAARDAERLPNEVSQVARLCAKHARRM